MNQRIASLTRTALAAGALAAALLASCGASGNGGDSHATSGPMATGEPPPSAKATVLGTALDAATGAPLEGVEIVAPGGATARTDAQGRFTLAGLAAGTAGALTAALEDGRRASVELRPLSAGERLEVVLHLRRTP